MLTLAQLLRPFFGIAALVHSLSHKTTTVSRNKGQEHPWVAANHATRHQSIRYTSQTRQNLATSRLITL